MIREGSGPREDGLPVQPMRVGAGSKLRVHLVGDELSEGLSSVPVGSCGYIHLFRDEAFIAFGSTDHTQGREKIQAYMKERRCGSWKDPLKLLYGTKIRVNVTQAGPSKRFDVQILNAREDYTDRVLQLFKEGAIKAEQVRFTSEGFRAP